MPFARRFDGWLDVGIQFILCIMTVGLKAAVRRYRDEKERTMVKLIIAMLLSVMGCNQVSGAADIVFETEKEVETEDGGDSDTGTDEDTDEGND